MMFFVIGTNHRHSPLEVRERLFFSKAKACEARSLFRRLPGVEASVILSTCNRAEIYVWCEDPSVAAERFSEAFAFLHGSRSEDLGPFLYVYEDAEAVRHLLRVACGLDSQTLGEPQILGQVERAVDDAVREGALCGQAEDFFRQAVLAARRIREVPGVPVGRSIAERAVNVAREYHGGLDGKCFLMIGTGKVMELFIPLIEERRIRAVFAANRNREKAEAWAAGTGGRAVSLECIGEVVPFADTIVSATSCPHVILKKEHLSHRERPLLVLDLAVPRDVESSVKGMPGVRLLDLDDLGAAAVDAARDDVRVRAAEESVFRESLFLWKILSGSEPEKALSR